MAGDGAPCEPILLVEDLSVSYGVIRAVRRVSLSLDAGEILTIVGPNGAGKSSLLLALVGLVPHRGSCRLKGRQIAGAPTEAIVRAGLTLCPEGRRVFAGLSVAENLRLGFVAAGERRVPGERLEELLALFPRLKERYRQNAGTLSGGEQQMLAMARAMAGAPDVLLLDEPSLGLAPQISETIFEVIQALRAQGQSIVLVEQNVENALAIADTACVMTSGEIVKSGTAAAIARDDAVRDAYFGVA
ncbi:MAG: ABC transporter ATP-binding protein [Pseudomonadota bacterium]